jgi:hypothetical protein
VRHDHDLLEHCTGIAAHRLGYSRALIWHSNRRKHDSMDRNDQLRLHMYRHGNDSSIVHSAKYVNEQHHNQGNVRRHCNLSVRRKLGAFMKLAIATILLALATVHSNRRSPAQSFELRKARPLARESR